MNVIVDMVRDGFEFLLYEVCEYGLIPTKYVGNEYMLALHRALKPYMDRDMSLGESYEYLQRYLSHRLHVTVSILVFKVDTNAIRITINILPPKVSAPMAVANMFRAYLGTSINTSFSTLEMREYCDGILTGLCLATRNGQGDYVYHQSNCDMLRLKPLRRNRKNRNKGALHILYTSSEKYYFYEPTKGGNDK